VKAKEKKTKTATDDPRIKLFRKICYRAELEGVIPGYTVEIDPRKGQEEWIRVWSATGKCVAGFSALHPWSDEQIDAELKNIGPRLEGAK
jgi:hypothetical protein